MKGAPPPWASMPLPLDYGDEVEIVPSFAPAAAPGTRGDSETDDD
jgi:hypothetical protein